PPEAGAQSHLGDFLLSEPRKIPFMAGGRNRERMLLSRYMTPLNFDSVTRGGFTRAGIMLAILLSSAPASFAQAGGGVALSPTERKIRDYVRAHQAEQISFLEKAVNISSGTFNLPGVREVG